MIKNVPDNPTLKFNPYLIQRVQRRTHPQAGKKGVDTEFSFDYMGSSEFEWGSLPASLRYMRVQPNIASMLVVCNHTLYYLGPVHILGQLVGFLKDELSAEWPANRHTMERTEMWRSLNFDLLEPRTKKYFRPFDGWWCISDNHERQDRAIWLLFRKADDRDLWDRLMMEDHHE
jgi:hypothetical protein